MAPKTSYGADSTGRLTRINCYITTPIKISNGGNYTQPYIFMYSLPSISDSHGASYAEESPPGRSVPIKIFDKGESRKIGWKISYYAWDKARSLEILNELRLLQSLTYPRTSTVLPVIPPPTCKLYCGKLFGNDEISAILLSVSVSYPQDVSWDYDTLLPIAFDVDLQFEVVYSAEDLPGQDRILSIGN